MNQISLEFRISSNIKIAQNITIFDKNIESSLSAWNYEEKKQKTDLIS